MPARWALGAHMCPIPSPFRNSTVNTRFRHQFVDRAFTWCTLSAHRGTTGAEFPTVATETFFTHVGLCVVEPSRAVAARRSLVSRPLPRGACLVRLDLVEVLLVGGKTMGDRDCGHIHTRHEVTLALAGHVDKSHTGSTCVTLITTNAHIWRCFSCRLSIALRLSRIAVATTIDALGCCIKIVVLIVLHSVTF